MTYREKRDFIVEIDEPFDDHASGSRPTSFLRILPGPVDLFGRTDDALPVSRRAHYRLHDARRPDLPDGFDELLVVGSETVRRSRDAEFLGSQPADAFAIHREAGGPGRRDHVVAFLFQFQQRIRSDRLDLGNNIVGLFLLDDGAQLRPVEHRKHVRAMSYLHGGSVRVTVQRDDFDAVPLQLDGDLLAQFAGAAKDGFLSQRG